MGERKQPQLLFWQGREMQWCGAESGASCQHIHMSSLFRHTLENVTSFQARPGKGSAAVGGKSPGLWPACTKAASHRVYAVTRSVVRFVCFCMLRCRLMTWVLRSRLVTLSPPPSYVQKEIPPSASSDPFLGDRDAHAGARGGTSKRTLSVEKLPRGKCVRNEPSLRWIRTGSLAARGTQGVLRLWGHGGGWGVTWTGMRKQKRREEKEEVHLCSGEMSHTKLRRSRILVPGQHLPSGQRGLTELQQ